MAGAAVSAVLLVTAWRLGAPAPVLLRMGGNIAVDTLVGAVPGLGDAFDFGWKANRRNMRLLERYEEAPADVVRGSRLVLALLLLGLLTLLAASAVGGFFLLRWLVSPRAVSPR